MRVRLGVRLLIINVRNEVLLIQHRDAVAVDPKNPGMLAYWMTPGGGLEGDETFEGAAVRESREETGITDVEIGPWIWSREKHVIIRGEDVLKRERYHLVRVNDPAVSFDHIEEAERPVFKAIRWWSLESMVMAADVISPPRLTDFLPPILNGNLPTQPVRIPH